MTTRKQIPPRHPFSLMEIIAILAGVSGVLSFFVPYVTGYFGHFQTVEEAKKHQAHDEQQQAWQTYGIADVKATLLRNRVNDCDDKTIKSERSCAQYRSEFEDARLRAQKTYDAAIATTKEK